MYAPVVDGVVVPDTPLRMMQTGRAANRDTLLGECSLEPDCKQQDTQIAMCGFTTLWHIKKHL